MGINKKLLLLALLVLTNVSYSKTVTSGTGIWAAGKEGINKENEELIVTGTGTGVTIKFEKEKEGTGINNGLIKVDGEKAKGMNFSTASTTTKPNSAINKGTIKVINNGTGIEANSKSEITNTETGKIKVDGGTGIKLNNTNAVLKNEGTLDVISGTGILQKGGKTTNKGTITISKEATGLDLQGGSFENDKTIENGGKINISSTKDNYTGIVNKGTINNTGEIKVDVSGKNGVGIQLNSTEAKLTNGSNATTGKIIVSKGTGVKVTNGTFINEQKGNMEILAGNGVYQSAGETINKGTVDIKGGNGFNIVNGKLNNKGIIIVNKGNGIIQKGGSTTNIGTINIAGGTGINQTNGSVSNAGNINISKGALGLNLQGGKFENTGTIINAGEMKLSSTLTQKGTVTNNGKVTIDVAGSGAGINQSTGTFTNNLQVDVNGGKGFYVTGGEVSNNGTINVNSSTGLQLQGETAKFTNNNLIKVNEGTGVIVSGETKNEKGEIVPTFVNSTTGRVEVAAGKKGVQVNKGSAENQGSILATGTSSIGIHVNGTTAKFENKDKAQILASGKDSKGIYIGTNGGTATNAGVILVEKGGMGTFLQGAGSFENQKGSNILISDKDSKGIFLNSKGTATNLGNILVGYKVDEKGNVVSGAGGGIGAYLNNTEATFTNTSTGKIEVGKDSTGIQIKDGIAENQGNILVLGGTGVDISKGTFTNSTGTINIANGTGVKVSSGNFINDATGKLTIEKGTGISQTGGEVTNKGIITILKEALGLEIKGGSTTNTGTINIAGGTGINQTNGSVSNVGNINISKGVLGLNLQGGKFENTGTIINDGEMKLSSTLTQKGIVTNNGKVTIDVAGSRAGINQSIGIFTNNSQVDVKGGKGFYITGGEALNNGMISVNSSTGLQLQGSTVKLTNNNLIKVNEGTGVIVSGETKNEKGEILPTFVNSTIGRVEVAAGKKGVQVTKGSVENQGSVLATGVSSTGVYVNGATAKFENKDKAQILALGTGAKAVQFGTNGGTVINNGIIDVSLGAIGTYFGGNGTFDNSSNILVSGKDSKGIFLNSKGIAINSGNIFVSKEAIGVQVNSIDAKFINKENSNISVDEFSQGIQINKEIAINNGDIIATGNNATGIYLNAAEKEDKTYENAKFENKKGTIIASGENAKGIFFGSNGGIATNNGIIEVKDGGTGVFSYKGNLNSNPPNLSKNQNNFTNGKEGIINVYGEKSVGLLLDTLNDKGRVVNDGAINIYNQGTGVKLGGTTFTNSGTIEVKNSGTAIESTKDTNNTVVLKKGANIVGNIKGNTGVDVLAVEGGGEYKDLSITSYDKIVSLKSNEKSLKNAIISNSNISLEFNDGTKDYTNDELNKEKTGLTISDSNLIVDLKNKKENSSSLVDTGDEKLKLAGKMKLAFMSGNGQKEFNISEILGDKIEIGDANFGSSAMWEYIEDENGNVIAKKHSYIETVGKSQLEDFGKVLEQNENIGGDFGKGLTLLGLLDASQFTDAMTQLSGGVHGYTVDFTAINSRILSNTIKNRELSKDKSRNKALNSYNQDVFYINNNHKIDGLMNVNYSEDGVLGITEKQIMTNGKLGLVYGGAKGKAKFGNGKHGKADMDNLYLGGYYAYDFTDKLTLVSNANFVYSHTNVIRNIKFAKDNQYLNYSYKSTYPVFGVGGGATLYYTPYNTMNNSVTLYGGIDWTKIVQGNINENSDMKENKDNQNLTIKNIPVDEQMYDSVVPHIGLSLANNGYIFNRKYRLGVNVDYETELGNIKNGKKLKLSALNTPHRVETTERENIVSYSLNGALDLTEDFTIYGNYTKSNSDEYDAEKVETGFKYKMDRMSDLFVTGPLLGNIENNKLYSNRWTGVASFILDGEDDSDRSYYTEPIMGEEHSRGDYATSLKLKPKFTLSVRDKQTNWSYYFETYYMSNGIGIDLDKNERRKSETRLHGEARWSDQYSKGKYGFNIGYRNETTSAPTFSAYVGADRLKRGLHQFRFTPNFTYNLGNGFIFGGQTTGIIAYDYEGYRKGQTDFELENEYGITYNGLMPRWRFNVNYFREETWYDNDFRKIGRVKNTTTGAYEYVNVEGDRRYQSNQLRPRITYFFGNGGRVELTARIPLGNGYWYTSDDHGKKTAEKYDTRYGIKYYQQIAPGLTGMIGGEILTIKTKTTDHSSSNYGKETRDYSIRPTIGISYNF